MLYEEGGPVGHLDAETVRACKWNCEQCLMMGHPYVKVAAHGGAKFLWFSDEYKECFKKEWKSFKKQREKETAELQNLPAALPAPPGGEGACTAGGGDGKRKGAGKVERKTPHPAVKALADARKTVMAAKGVLSSTNTLLRAIRHDENYSTMNNASVRGKLESQEHDLKSLINDTELGKQLMLGIDAAEATGRRMSLLRRRRMRRRMMGRRMRRRRIRRRMRRRRNVSGLGDASGSHPPSTLEVLLHPRPS
eukprot:5730809-Pyramimonas_sp.AAC.1